MVYSLRQVEQIVGISAATVRRFVTSGLLAPERRGRALRFGFQDLIVLRLARGLKDAGLPARRIARALERLRAQLPEAPPISGLRIVAVGEEVVVMDGGRQWQAADGQYLLAYEFHEQAGELASFLSSPPSLASPAQECIARALAVEEEDAARAIELYGQALSSAGCQSAAFVNLGRLLHAVGRLSDAEAVYARGMAAHPDDALLLFNVAVLREDQGRHDEAIALYQRALANDPQLGDAHYNLGLLWQSAGRSTEAVRHFNAYRRLTAGSDAES